MCFHTNNVNLTGGSVAVDGLYNHTEFELTVSGSTIDPPVNMAEGQIFSFRVRWNNVSWAPPTTGTLNIDSVYEINGALGAYDGDILTYVYIWLNGKARLVKFFSGP